MGCFDLREAQATKMPTANGRQDSFILRLANDLPAAFGSQLLPVAVIIAEQRFMPRAVGFWESSPIMRSCSFFSE